MKARAVEAAILRDRAGRRILAAVRTTQREGWTITSGSAFCGLNRTCCPLMALRRLAGVDFTEAANLKLGWSHAGAWCFAMGFDAPSLNKARQAVVPTECTDVEFDRHLPSFELGRLFRKLLLTGDGEL